DDPVEEEPRADEIVPDALIPEQRRAVRRMSVLRRDPERRERGEDLLEPLALLSEGRVLGLVRGREVGIHGVDREVFAFCDLGQRPRDVVVAKSETVHPGIDLQMASELRADVFLPPKGGNYRILYVLRRGGLERLRGG